MSRLGRTPISIPKGVEVKASPGAVHIKGPKGTQEMKLPLGITLKMEGQEVVVERNEELEPSKAAHGLYRSLLKNALIGVTEGFEIRLSLVGVGYRANVVGNKLDMQLGFSHPTLIEIPKGVQVTVDKGVAISVKGLDKREVGQFAAAVRAMKPPEPYKGKGVRYENEYVRKKEGKAAKGKA
ncbi:MAG: 50S ribosomal protein L6 [Verrucomicrobiota bacterium]|nr:50S ribosomal protein L6 [Verrucomicrobiota bacterium]